MSEPMAERAYQYPSRDDVARAIDAATQKAAYDMPKPGTATGVGMVAREMGNLETRANVISKLIYELAAKLEPVMRPPVPNVGKETRADVPVPLGAAVAAITATLSDAGARLEDILSRLEL